MVMRDSYLYPILDAGSSRVFNVCRHTSKLLLSVQPDDPTTKFDPLFKSDALNKSIIVKETRPSKIAFHKYNQPMGSKIYFPYDIENIYDGGRSLFIDEPKIDLILKENFGMKYAEDDDANNDIVYSKYIK